MTNNETRRDRQDNLRPERENQATASGGGAEQPPEGPTESTAGADRDTGAGTGGATESEDRPGNHEAMHRGNQPNS